MKFRILDLIFLTTLIAMLLAIFQKDLKFFRQLFCFGMTSCFATAAILLFPELARRRTLGAIGGLIAGILYLVIGYVYVFRLYKFPDGLTVNRQSLVQDPAYLEWTGEIIPVLVFAVFFGSAIGPLLVLRLRKTVIPERFQRQLWFSIGLLLGMFLIGLLSMLDRFVNFGDVRDILPLLLIALIVFVIQTNVWISQLEADTDTERTESSG